MKRPGRKFFTRLPPPPRQRCSRAKGFPSTHRSLAGDIVIPSNFREFTHGYAVTSHKSQGRTADHVIVCAEKLDAKTAYVGCSRGRASCVVHTPDREKLFENLPHSGERKSALDFWKERQQSLRQAQDQSPTLSTSRRAGLALVNRVAAWKKVAGQFVERVKQRVQAFDFRRGQNLQDRARKIGMTRRSPQQRRGPGMRM